MRKISGRTPLSRWMKEAKIDDLALAMMLKISRAHASYLRRGVKTPSLELARRIELVSRGAVPIASFVDSRKRA